ncbi:MAG: ABC transporter permease subunit [Spirochaetes bacterium]|jgi:putative chitobiose transport system permease protein|nr:ABC transporter permease subunit [Spirochaetota bacterium]
MSSKLYKPVTPYLYLIPAGVVLAMFFFIPLGRAFIFSLTEYSLLSDPTWLGLENYRRLFTSESFANAFLNSFKYFLVVVPCLVVIPMLVAVLVNEPLRGVHVFRTMFYLPVVTSFVVAAIMWKWMYVENGVLNYFLTSILPVFDEPIEWLTNPRIALYSVMVVTIWKGIGYYMVIYLAGLQTIPSELYEVAKIDGASGLQKLSRITVPLLVPSMAVVAVLSSTAAMKVFDEVFVMTGGGPYETTRTAVFEIYDTAFDKLQFGYASAMGVILFSVLLVISLISLRVSEQRYTKN